MTSSWNNYQNKFVIVCDIVSVRLTFVLWHSIEFSPCYLWLDTCDKKNYTLQKVEFIYRSSVLGFVFVPTSVNAFETRVVHVCVLNDSPIFEVNI